MESQAKVIENDDNVMEFLQLQLCNSQSINQSVSLLDSDMTSFIKSNYEP